MSRFGSVITQRVQMVYKGRAAARKMADLFHCRHFLMVKINLWDVPAGKCWTSWTRPNVGVGNG